MRQIGIIDREDIHARSCERLRDVLDGAYSRYDEGHPAEEEKPKRYLKVVRASDINMRATRWLWEDEHGC